MKNYTYSLLLSEDKNYIFNDVEFQFKLENRKEVAWMEIFVLVDSIKVGEIIEVKSFLGSIKKFKVIKILSANLTPDKEISTAILVRDVK